MLAKVEFKPQTAGSIIGWLPPGVYLRASVALLGLTRRLQAAHLIGRGPLVVALRLANRLSTAAHASWRHRAGRPA